LPTLLILNRSKVADASDEIHMNTTATGPTFLIMSLLPF
jgi:hypothetical protein